MYEVAGELTVIPNTIWCFAKVRERMVVSKQTAEKFIVKYLISGS